MLPSTLSGPILIDAHVHLHPCCELGLLRPCRLNFERAARALRVAPSLSGVLALTEPAGVDRFGELRGLVGERSIGYPGGWELKATGESISMVAVHRDRRLLLIAGRQIRTRERLEVLAVGTGQSFADGRGLLDTARRVLEIGAFAILPWGFGKWWFGRRAVVREVLEALDAEGLFLGDNGGRPGLMRRPRLLQVAESSGIPVLSGSDPLPFPREVARVGRFGSLVRQDLEGRRPAGSLLDSLKGARRAPRDFGFLASLGSFIRTQVQLRLRGPEEGTAC